MPKEIEIANAGNHERRSWDICQEALEPMDA